MALPSNLLKNIQDAVQLRWGTGVSFASGSADSVNFKAIYFSNQTAGPVRSGTGSPAHGNEEVLNYGEKALRGNTGSSVRELQQKLNQNGYHLTRMACSAATHTGLWWITKKKE